MSAFDLISAASTSSTQVALTFNASVLADSIALNPSSYSIPGLYIDGVSAPGGATINLITSPQVQNKLYTVTITGNLTGTGTVPTVSAISVSNGPDVGGTPVTITGTGFTGATGASVDGSNLTSFVVVSDTSITGVTSAGSARGVQGNVVVVGAAGNGTLATAWEYVDMIVGLLSARPASATQGVIYWATDMNQMSTYISGAWIEMQEPDQQADHPMVSANWVVSVSDSTRGILNATGTQGAARLVVIQPPPSDDQARTYTLRNNTTDGFIVTATINAGLSSGSPLTVDVSPGYSTIITVDAAGVTEANSAL